jgi:hypothetical protein
MGPAGAGSVRKSASDRALSAMRREPRLGVRIADTRALELFGRARVERLAAVAIRVCTARSSTARVSVSERLLHPPARDRIPAVSQPRGAHTRRASALEEEGLWLGQELREHRSRERRGVETVTSEDGWIDESRVARAASRRASAAVSTPETRPRMLRSREARERT